MDKVAVGEGCERVELLVEQTEGRGLCAFLIGGDAPHVGGVVLAVVSPRLERGGETCDISQICLPGHKDVIAGAEAARLLACEAGQPVSLTCGIHADGADAEVISRLMENCTRAAQAWLCTYGPSAHAKTSGNSGHEEEGVRS